MRVTTLHRLALPILALLAACAAEDPQRAAERPNIVIYLVDTLRADHLGLYGYERDTSPRLDAFARDAVVFENSYSPSSWTRPSAASLLTGQSPERHGAIGRSSPLASGVRLLGDWLRPAGYHTAAFSSNANVLPVWGFDRGFDDFYDIDSVAFTATAADVNDVVFRHMNEKLHAPFALYIHTLDPHAPYAPPEPFASRWPRPSAEELASSDIATSARAKVLDTIAAYDGEIAFNDHHFGRLLDRLRRDGRYDDSMIVFVSDHGEDLWDHGAAGHGYSLYEEVVRVPLVVKFPGNAHAGTRVGESASLLDVLPTVLAAAGIDAPAEVEGVGLKSLLIPDRRSPERPHYLSLNLTGVSEQRFVADGVVLGHFKLLTSTEPRPGIALFDLESDPRETRSALGREREVGRHLRHLLEGHRRDASGGVHFWVVNGPGASERVVEGLLRTTDRFENLRTSDFEPGDEARLEEEGRALRFRLELRDFQNPVDNAPKRIIDHDRMLFDTSTADAEIRVEAFEIDGVPAPIYLGGAKRAAGAAPLTIRASSEELRVPRMDLLLEEGIERSLDNALGAYVGVVERLPATEIEMDEDIRARLRELGYVE